MLTKPEAELWVRRLLETWNTHDIDAAMQFYREDVEYVSPFAARMLKVPGGVLHGKARLRAYLGEVLEAFPEAHFELHDVFCGAQSVVVVYGSAVGLQVAEVLTLDENDLVIKSITHYR